MYARYHQIPHPLDLKFDNYFELPGKFLYTADTGWLSLKRSASRKDVYTEIMYVLGSTRLNSQPTLLYLETWNMHCASPESFELSVRPTGRQKGFPKQNTTPLAQTHYVVVFSERRKNITHVAANEPVDW
ncbi:unnamed protein product [Cyberlindnera jadinii]|uniref:Uncharacterized protein n=1 Tax=Cyberlindnera jadinii (strain ATCC 18201 / CBS 1600 / BCRC 20928 / JCM 3617 / NBRC 0987 / NRRL Y-1542) TaxID=983966 RepID=A0A0H5BYB8_CYBJN|nr:unnamed protein product [Cyberlindnera jadinii]